MRAALFVVATTIMKPIIEVHMHTRTGTIRLLTRSATIAQTGSDTVANAYGIIV